MAQELPPLDEQAAKTREHQLRFIYNVLARRWLMIVASAVAGAAALASWDTLSRDTPKQLYGATAKVLVVQSLWDKDILKGVGGTPLVPVDAQSLVKRTSRRQLAEKVAHALVQLDISAGGASGRIATEPEYAAKADEIYGYLSIEAEDLQSGLIAIEARNCPSDEEARRIAEFAARVFVEENRQLRLEEETRTHEAIQKKLQELQQELYVAETAQWDFKKEMGFRTYGRAGEEMAEIYQELSEKSATREETQAKLTELAAQLQNNREQLPEALGNVTDTVVDEMLADLNRLLQEKLTMSVVYQPGFSGLQEVQDEIAEKRQAILQAVQQLDEGVGGGTSVWRQRQNMYRQQLELRLELTGLDIRIAALKRMIEEMIPRIPELANENLKYERLENEARHIRDQFNRLREKEFDIRTALSRETGQVERHESVMASLLPVAPVGLRLWMNFGIGALVGAVVSFALAVMFEIMDTSIRTIEDVTDYIGLEVIGTIPKMRFGKPSRRHRRMSTYVAVVDEDQIDACIVTQHDPKSPISEAYRALRTNFQFASIKLKPKTVMVTSAVPGEGKTTTAVNMAVTMADCGIRVRLVDTDLRRPNVHRVLKMERGPGLADVLRGEADLAGVVRKTRVENLWIVSSGRVPPNPSELIGSERMAALMAELGRDFGLVVCDAPSILVVTDPVLLATHVDTTVLVVSVNNARRETIQRAHKLLQAASAKIAGVVLNGLETTRRHYYYYYYYYEDGRGQRRKFSLGI